MMRVVRNQETGEYVALNGIQNAAFGLGAPLELAVNFREVAQLLALRNHAVDAPNALRFSNIWQTLALGYGMWIEDSLRFENMHQIKALELGVPLELALRFENEYQVDALVAGGLWGRGVAVEIALLFTEGWQVEALGRDVPIEEILGDNLPEQQVPEAMGVANPLLWRGDAERLVPCTLGIDLCHGLPAAAPGDDLSMQIVP